MNFGYQIFNILLEKEIPIVSKVSGVIVMQIMNIFGVRRVRSSRFRTQDSGAPNFRFRVFRGFSGFRDLGFRVQDFRVRDSGLEKHFPPHVKEVELLINRASKADRSKSLQIVKPPPNSESPFPVWRVSQQRGVCNGYSARWGQNAAGQPAKQQAATD